MPDVNKASSADTSCLYRTEYWPSAYDHLLLPYTRRLLGLRLTLRNHACATRRSSRLRRKLISILRAALSLLRLTERVTIMRHVLESATVAAAYHTLGRLGVAV